MSDDSTQYLTRMAAQLGLTLPAQELGRVLSVYGNLERAAAQLAALPIPDEGIAAAVFRPLEGPDHER